MADVAVDGEAVAPVHVGLDIRHLAAHVVAHPVGLGAEAVDVDAVLVGLDLRAVQAAVQAAVAGGGAGGAGGRQSLPATVATCCKSERQHGS